ADIADADIADADIADADIADADIADADIRYDPDKGQQLLEEAGWRDENRDGIREAYDVPGFTDETPLSLTLHLAPQYFVTAAYIAADLEQCGVAVTPIPTEAQLLYAADAVSPLFDRTFQMAIFGWQTLFPQVCGAWRSDRIPTEENNWIGENFSGYDNAVYDATCQRALTAIDVEVRDTALWMAQDRLLKDLPTLFIAWRAGGLVARSEVRGIQPDMSAPSLLWNVESFSVTP
ncbi:MAG: hypothetical protein JXA33_28790, partial [Anaerolineae bacterium]|nr:hypothetical protein [Anaerolineae bacterium]